MGYFLAREVARRRASSTPPSGRGRRTPAPRPRAGPCQRNPESLGAADYLRCQSRLVRGWREAWGVGNFAFCFVQLPNFAAPPEQDRSHEAQARRAALLLEAATAVTINAGETASIQSPNKQTVGHRPALSTRARDYGQPVA